MRELLRQEHRLSGPGTLLCPMIDARRMEVYDALFDMEAQMIREIRAEIITEHSFSEYLNQYAICFFGENIEKCKPYLANHPNAIIREGFLPSSRYMVPLAGEHFEKKHFEDLAYFEPFYLKDFIAGKPRVKGLS